MMQLVENTAVELKDGRRGLILGVRDNEEIVQYDVELGDGEIITVFAEEVRRPV